MVWFAKKMCNSYIHGINERNLVAVLLKIIHFKKNEERTLSILVHNALQIRLWNLSNIFFVINEEMNKLGDTNSLFSFKIA